METPVSTARAALDALQGHEAWAVIRLRDAATVTLVGGARSVVERLLDVPLEEGVPDGRPALRPAGRDPVPAGRRARLRGARRRHPAGRRRHRARAEVAARASCSRRCPTTAIEFADRGGFDTDDEEYGDAGRGDHPRRDRPGRGRQPRRSAGTTAPRSPTGAPAKALTVFRRLLRARARRLLDLLLLHRRPVPRRRQPRAARLGARRRRPDEPDQRHLPARAGSTDPAERKARLLEFLADEKEIYELFMVVDEELKMMCDICHEGGQVLGPFLKPMTHLVHTEYLLAGRTDRDVREVLRDTMYAATVTGSPGRERLPADQAVRDRGPRLLRRRARPARPRRARAGPTADSPIVIRTADVDLDGPAQGHRRRDAGARLRRRRTRSPRRTPRPAASSAPFGLVDAGDRRGRRASTS